MLVDIILMPLFYGCDISGVDLGPETLINHNVEKIINNHFEIKSISQVDVEQVNSSEKYSDHQKLKYLNPIIKANQNLRDLVSQSLNQNHFPLVIGGDHALALGSLAAIAKNDPDTVVIWVDAHGDINTDETTSTGNIHGMPLASAFNLSLDKLNHIFENNFLKPENLIYLGVRSLDPGEIEIIEKFNITHFTSQHIQELKIENILELVKIILKQKDPKHVHLSFDIDVLDASLVPGTGTPEIDGLNLDEVHQILKELAELDIITSMDFVEFNPSLDQENQTLKHSLVLLETFFNNLNNSK